jgi:peptidoglycan/xylan/chitin deacetylase (PgdA/CDA1 family)
MSQFLFQGLFSAGPRACFWCFSHSTKLNGACAVFHNSDAKLSRAQFLSQTLFGYGALFTVPHWLALASARAEAGELQSGTETPREDAFKNEVGTNANTNTKAAATRGTNSDPLSIEPLGPEETKYWAKKKAALDADPEVQMLRQVANDRPPIKTASVGLQFGMLVPEDGHLAPGQIALTFDDGPVPTVTKMILRALDEYSVPATFFQMGANARANPELSKLLVQHGHSVGSHTMNHPHLGQLAESLAQEEIIEGHKAVLAATGVGSNFFRFPFGEETPALVDFIQRSHLSSFKWNMEAQDWRFDGADDFYGHDLKRLLKAIMAEIDGKGRGIILMHDLMCTALVLPDVLNYLRIKDLTVVRFVQSPQVSEFT